MAQKKNLETKTKGLGHESERALARASQTVKNPRREKEWVDRELELGAYLAGWLDGRGRALTLKPSTSEGGVEEGKGMCQEIRGTLEPG